MTNNIPYDDELHAQQVIEGEVIFGFYNFANFLCETESDAQLVLENTGNPIPSQELLSRHAVLREADVNLQYSCNIIDSYRQEITVCVDKETYEAIWTNPSYDTLDQQQNTKYLKAYAQEIVPGIWRTTGHVEVNIRPGWPLRRHVHMPVTSSPRLLYMAHFLKGLRHALDDVARKDIQKICSQEDISRHPIYMTCTFKRDRVHVPLSVQQEALIRMHHIRDEPTLINNGVESLQGFIGIFRIHILEDYWVIYTIDTEISSHSLYLLRLSHRNDMFQKSPKEKN